MFEVEGLTDLGFTFWDDSQKSGSIGGEGGSDIGNFNIGSSIWSLGMGPTCLRSIEASQHRRFCHRLSGNFDEKIPRILSYLIRGGISNIFLENMKNSQDLGPSGLYHTNTQDSSLDFCFLIFDLNPPLRARFPSTLNPWFPGLS